MKGIDAAVATILLLTITISLIGFSFVWFNRLTKSTAKSIEQQTEQQQNLQAMRIKILSAKSGSLTIQNIGTVPINESSIAVFVDGTYQSSFGSATLAPNQIATSTSLSCTAGQEVKVTTPGGDDYYTCE